MYRFSRIILVGCAFLLSIMLIACAGNVHKESTGNYIDDTVVTTKVKTALLAEKGIKSHQITVNTFKGRVQLSGFVTNKAESEKAAHVASQVPGVSVVENDLKIK